MFQGSRYADGGTVESVNSIITSESLSLRENRVGLSGQRYEIGISMVFDRRNVARLHARLAAHIDSVGGVRIFTIPMLQPAGTGPELPTSTETERMAADFWNSAPWNAGRTLEPMPGYLQSYLATDRLVLDEQAVAGATSVNLRRTTAAVRELVAGRFITFAGSTKLHRVLTGATFPAIGTVRTITISPALRANVAALSYVRLNPVATVRYALDSDLTVTHNSRVFNAPRLDLIEAV